VESERIHGYVVGVSNFESPPPPLRDGLRSEWLLRDDITFLNHGSFGALPKRVFEEQADWRRRIEAEPIEMIARRRIELLQVAKQKIADFVHADPNDFGFVTNATDGINAVLRSMRLRAGDELLTTSHVYNAVRKAMQYVSGGCGATYREVDVPLPVTSSDQIAERVLSGLSNRTRLLVIDHVTSPTALVFPIRRIIAECNARKIDVLVDGAHVPGMLPLDIPSLGASYYTGNLHKWAASPKGTGILWVRKDRQADVHPLIVSHHYGEGFVAEFGWQGTRDLAAWLAAPAGLSFMAELGFDRIMSHNHAMAAWVQRMLCKRWNAQPISPVDGSLLGSMASIRLPGRLRELTESQGLELNQRLYSEFKIEVPIMVWKGHVLTRPCCQVYNTPGEYERLADVVSELAK
jgi:isopenicillin-N epimerase